MKDTEEQAAEDFQGISRRDFLKLCSLTLGGLALPGTFTGTLDRALAALKPAPFVPELYFQWQNDILFND